MGGAYNNPLTINYPLNIQYLNKKKFGSNFIKNSIPNFCSKNFFKYFIIIGELGAFLNDVLSFYKPMTKLMKFLAKISLHNSLNVTIFSFPHSPHNIFVFFIKIFEINRANVFKILVTCLCWWKISIFIFSVFPLCSFLFHFSYLMIFVIEKCLSIFFLLFRNCFQLFFLLLDGNFY